VRVFVIVLLEVLVFAQLGLLVFVFVDFVFVEFALVLVSGHEQVEEGEGEGVVVS
jgi:hypothetical protein